MSETPVSPNAKNSLGVPIAIVIGAGLIALAVFMSGGRGPGGPDAGTAVKIPNPAELAEQAPEPVVKPVSAEDNIKGNPNAPIVIVEYSDYDCPFCKNFHETMNRIMAEYGPTGKVAWVYRHFPLVQLHPNAPKISEAAECVAELGGNDAFWKFSDLIFEERGTNEPTNMTRLAEFATQAGVEKAAFDTCLNSGKYTEKIAASVQEAIAAGARGTPYSIMIAGNQQGPINGAQPYEVVKQMIDTVLRQIEGGAAAN